MHVLLARCSPAPPCAAYSWVAPRRLSLPPGGQPPATRPPRAACATKTVLRGMHSPVCTMRAARSALVHSVRGQMRLGKRRRMNRSYRTELGAAATTPCRRRCGCVSRFPACLSGRFDHSKSMLPELCNGRLVSCASHIRTKTAMTHEPLRFRHTSAVFSTDRLGHHAFVHSLERPEQEPEEEDALVTHFPAAVLRPRDKNTMPFVVTPIAGAHATPASWHRRYRSSAASERWAACHLRPAPVGLCGDAARSSATGGWST